MKTLIQVPEPPPPSSDLFFNEETNSLVFVCPDLAPRSSSDTKYLVVWLHNGLDQGEPRFVMHDQHPSKWVGWKPLNRPVILHINP